MLLIGDVALAHDIGGLLAAARLELKLTIVLLDNGGGGIFDFLPVSRDAPSERRRGDIYTRHVATPTGLDFAHAAALYGLRTSASTTVAGFRAALERALGAPALERSSRCATERARERRAARARGASWRARVRAAALSQRAAAAAPAA